jgi:hypothetical protein
MNPQPPPPLASGLTELEKPGILLSRLLHEVTNSLSVLAGHVQLLEMQPSQSQLTDSIRSIKWASDSIGEIVERYVGFRREIPRVKNLCTFAELCAALKTGHPEVSSDAKTCEQSWRVSVPANATGQLELEPRWLRFAVWELARSTGVEGGNIQVFGPQDAFDRRGLKSQLFNANKTRYIHILLSWSSAKPAFGEQVTFKPPTMSLALAVGIVRWASGQACYDFIEPNENRFWMILPEL